MKTSSSVSWPKRIIAGVCKLSLPIPPFDDVLKHSEHVASPLRLIRAKQAGSVQNAGRNQPAGPATQAIGPREVKNAVFALVPIFQAPANLVLCRPRLQAHERVAKV